MPNQSYIKHAVPLYCQLRKPYIMEKKHTRELQITSQRELINLTDFTRLALLLPTYCTFLSLTSAFTKYNLSKTNGRNSQTSSCKTWIPARPKKININTDLSTVQSDINFLLTVHLMLKLHVKVYLVDSYYQWKLHACDLIEAWTDHEMC